MVTFLLRRTAVGWIGMLSLIAYLSLSLTSTAWHHDAGAAVNWATSGGVLVLPLTFAAAAHDSAMWVRRNRSLSSAPSLGLGRHSILVATAYAIAALVAWLLAVAICLCVAAKAGTPMLMDPALWIQPPANIAAVAYVGAALGLWFPQHWTPLLVGIGYFVLGVVAAAGTPFARLLAPLGFTGWNATVELDPLVTSVKALTLATAAVMAVVACRSFDIARQTRQLRVARVMTICLAASVVCGAVLASMVQAPGSNGVRPVALDTSNRRCFAVVSSEFCTYEAEGLADEFADDVTAAVTALGHPFPLRATYVDDRTVDGADENIGLWSIDASLISDGTIDPYAAATTLARPVACEAYFADDGDPRILQAATFLADWIVAYRDADNTAGRSASWQAIGAWPVPWATAHQWRDEALTTVKSCDGNAWPH